MRRTKPLVWILALSIGAALYFGYAYLAHRKYQRLGMYTAKRHLERAYSEFERTGTLPPSEPHAQLTPYTNAVVIGGATQHCVIALDWAYFRGHGFLAISTNRSVFWIGSRTGPHLLVAGYRGPFF